MLNNNWGREVECSELWASLYTPWSDSFLPGSLLPHGISNGFAGFGAGCVVSLVANGIYNLIKTKWFPILQFHADQNWQHHTIQFATRAVVHVITGAGMGLIMGLILSQTAAITTMGCAVGVAAFIGPQLIRLICKVISAIFSRIFPYRLTENGKEIIQDVKNKAINFVTNMMIEYIAKDLAELNEHQRACVIIKIQNYIRSNDQQEISEWNNNETIVLNLNNQFLVEFKEKGINSVNEILRHIKKNNIINSMNKYIDIIVEAFIQTFDLTYCVNIELILRKKN